MRGGAESARVRGGGAAEREERARRFGTPPELCRAVGRVRRGGMNATMRQEKEQGCLSSRILDTTETLGMKLQQTLWVSKEQAKAAEQLRGLVVATRGRIETYAPRVERIVGEVENLAAQSEELGAIGSELSTREETARREVLNAVGSIDSLREELGRVRDAARANGALVQDLLAATQEVVKLLERIGKITRQTQLLALNAAIEAARAGDAGRGFGVVASEVGKLAASTQEIAGEIDRAVSDMRVRLTQVVEAMTREREAIDHGHAGTESAVRIIGGAGESVVALGERFRDLVRIVEEQARAAEVIAEETHVIGGDTGEVLGEVNRLGSALEKEAQSAERFAATMEEMSREVLGLQFETARNRPEEELWVGFTPFAEPGYIKKSFGGIMESLARKVGKRLRLFVSADYETLGRLVAEGAVDLGWFSPLAYVVAADRVPMRVLAIPKVKGRPSYQGLIVARKDAGITSLGDLRGKVFAFVDPSSGSGYLYPRVLLQEKGYDPDTFFGEVRFLGSHDRVIEAAVKGGVPAGATYTDAWDAASRKMDLSVLQILARTEDIPKDAIAVRQDAPGELAELLEQELLRLSPADPLAGGSMKQLSIDGFVPGSDDMYDILRRAREAERRMRRSGRA